MEGLARGLGGSGGSWPQTPRPPSRPLGVSIETPIRGVGETKETKVKLREGVWCWAMAALSKSFLKLCIGTLFDPFLPLPPARVCKNAWRSCFSTRFSQLMLHLPCALRRNLYRDVGQQLTGGRCCHHPAPPPPRALFALLTSECRGAQMRRKLDDRARVPHRVDAKTSDWRATRCAARSPPAPRPKNRRIAPANAKSC